MKRTFLHPAFVCAAFAFPLAFSANGQEPPKKTDSCLRADQCIAPPVSCPAGFYCLRAPDGSLQIPMPYDGVAGTFGGTRDGFAFWDRTGKPAGGLNFSANYYDTQDLGRRVTVEISRPPFDYSLFWPPLRSLRRIEQLDDTPSELRALRTAHTVIQTYLTTNVDYIDNIDGSRPIGGPSQYVGKVRCDMGGCRASFLFQCPIGHVSPDLCQGQLEIDQPHVVVMVTFDHRTTGENLALMNRIASLMLSWAQPNPVR